jgi:hypothetical protein
MPGGKLLKKLHLRVFTFRFPRKWNKKILVGGKADEDPA